MAQLFSSGTSPEYLKAMADAYAMYFPQQQTYNPQTQQTTTGTLTPEYQQALQQWYGAAGNAPTAVVPSPQQQSIVGGLFEDLYPQTANRGGSGDRTRQFSNLTDREWAAIIANRDENGWNNPYDMSGLKAFGSAALGMLTGNPLSGLASAYNYGQTQKSELQNILDRYIDPNPQGTLANVPITNQVVDPMQAAQAAAIAREYESSRGGVGGDFGGNNPGYGNTGDRDSMGRDTGRTGTSF